MVYLTILANHRSLDRKRGRNSGNHVLLLHPQGNATSVLALLALHSLLLNSTLSFSRPPKWLSTLSFVSRSSAARGPTTQGESRICTHVLCMILGKWDIRPATASPSVVGTPAIHRQPAQLLAWVGLVVARLACTFLTHPLSVFHVIQQRPQCSAIFVDIYLRG
jgi:hypothetical protein